MSKYSSSESYLKSELLRCNTDPEVVEIRVTMRKAKRGEQAVKVVSCIACGSMHTEQLILILFALLRLLHNPAITAIRLPCCGPVTSRKFICNPDVTDYVGFRLTYPRSDRLLTNSIAGCDIHPREYVNNTASLRCFIVISLVPTVVVIQMCR